MRSKVLCWGAAALLVSASYGVGAKNAETARLLDARSLDPALLLPPPPAPGSEEQRRELREVQAVVAAASPAERAKAEYDDAHEDPGLFDETLAQEFSLRQHPATWALLTKVQGEAEAAATAAKRHFERTRPWGDDPRLVPCGAKPGRKPTWSYPSGHAMLGYSTGLVLADLLPDRAAFILARARAYASERIVCAEHYPSDLEASHVLASIVVARLEAVPAFRSDMDAARAEIRAALPPAGSGTVSPN